MVRFGLQHNSFAFDGKGHEIFQSVKKQALYAEAKGFDSFWVMDHLHQIPYVGRPEEPILEGWSTISALAAVTSKIKVGTLVTGNIYRNPAHLAKLGATVDVMSGGRLFMGIGAGWYEAEAVAYGIPHFTVGERLRRLGEALQIIKGMWTSEAFSFEGKYYHVKGAICNPKPVQTPHPPILIGGGGENVTLKLVAKYGDACNIFGGPATVRRKFEKLREHCSAVGRDYGKILRTRQGRLIIGEDEAEVDALVSANRRPDQSEEEYSESVTYGTPDQVAAKLREFIDAGVEYFTFNIAARNADRVLRMMAEKVMPEFT